MNERIVQTFTWEGEPDGVSLETMTFVDLGNERTRIETRVRRRHDGGPGRDDVERHGRRRERGLRQARRAARVVSTPAENHRRVAGTFTDRVRGVSGADGWDAPAPVAGWTARDVVGHLVEWFPGFLAGGSDIRLPAGPSVADDPAGAWQAQCDAVQAVLDDPSSAAKMFVNPHTGDVPLPEAIDRFYTADVFMHTWDLARATGQDDTLDAEYCAELLDGHDPVRGCDARVRAVRTACPGTRRRARAGPDARVHRPRPELAPRLTARPHAPPWGPTSSSARRRLDEGDGVAVRIGDLGEADRVALGDRERLRNEPAGRDLGGDVVGWRRPPARC